MSASGLAAMLCNVMALGGAGSTQGQDYPDDAARGSPPVGQCRGV